ncbi:MAG TPA: hypothetical protein DIW24_02980 [Bacteroidetes bacterium]|nr:hypothetical protein [Bacteroidota bacterium]HRR08321.1 hypothetical protein [Rhodothermales bacterium]
MAKFVHHSIYRLGDALAASLKEEQVLPPIPPQVSPDALQELADLFPRPSESLTMDEAQQQEALPPLVPDTWTSNTFADAPSLTATVPPIPPELPQTVVVPSEIPVPLPSNVLPETPMPNTTVPSYPSPNSGPDVDLNEYPDAVNYNTGNPTAPPAETSIPVNVPSGPFGKPYALPNVVYQTEGELVNEAVDSGWRNKNSWLYAGMISMAGVIGIAALVVYAYLTLNYYSLALAITGTGVIAFFTTLYASNRLSNSSDLDKGEYRKAITTSFILVYFLLIGAKTATDTLASSQIQMGTLLDQFTYLVGMIVGFYFTSSIVRDWRQADVASDDVPYTEGEGG